MYNSMGGWSPYSVNHFLITYAFWSCCSRRLLKTLWQKEKLQTRNLSFCFNVFYFMKIYFTSVPNLSCKGFVPDHTKRRKTLRGRDQSDHEFMTIYYQKPTYRTKMQIDDLIMQLTLKLSQCGICADAVDLSKILRRYDVAISHIGSPKFWC